MIHANLGYWKVFWSQSNQWTWAFVNLPGQWQLFRGKGTYCCGNQINHYGCCGKPCFVPMPIVSPSFTLLAVITNGRASQIDSDVYLAVSSEQTIPLKGGNKFSAFSAHPQTVLYAEDELLLSLDYRVSSAVRSFPLIPTLMRNTGTLDIFNTSAQFQHARKVQSDCFTQVRSPAAIPVHSEHRQQCILVWWTIHSTTRGKPEQILLKRKFSRKFA